MSIRTRLVGAFLLVALLVPVLGLVAVRGVSSVNGNVENLGRDAIPTLDTVRTLDALQREQQVALLSYATTGRDEDRARYQERSQAFDRALAELQQRASGGSGSSAKEIARLAGSLMGERARFGSAATQLINARAAIDKGSADLRAKNEEIVRDLNLITARTVFVGRPQATLADLPAAARRDNADMLLATEGILRIVQQEMALAGNYVITGDATLSQQFESTGLGITNWLQIANAAATADDRAVLARVQDRFFKEFEPAARSMILSADFSTRARGVFGDATASIISTLDQIVSRASSNADRSRVNAEDTAGSAGRLIVLITVFAFAVAGALGVWFAGTITRPLRHLREVADRVSRGDLAGVEVMVDSADEVGDLARAFRRMVTSLRILMPTPGEDVPLGRV